MIREKIFMSASAASTVPIPWYKEPTKDQWLAWVAAWLGWTLDAFDFTIFLMIMVPIAKDFGVPLTEVAIVFTLTLWMRLVGATASGWLADRIGGKIPLMNSMGWGFLLKLRFRVFPRFLCFFSFASLARHRHGGGMAMRGGVGDGAMADPLARAHGRRLASL